MTTLQNRTVFVISSLVLKEGVQILLYFYERGASFKNGWEPMLCNEDSILLLLTAG